MMRTQRFTINENVLTVECADGFWSRLLGLMGRKELERGSGLLISSCNSVHMMFMRFSIDVVYLDESYTIKKIVRNLRPWLGVSMCWGAWAALELVQGEVDRLHLHVGQKLLPILT